MSAGYIENRALKYKVIDGEVCDAVLFFETSIDMDERMQFIQEILEVYFHETPKGKWFKEHAKDSDVEVFKDWASYQRVYRIYGYLTPKQQTVFSLKFSGSDH